MFAPYAFRSVMLALCAVFVLAVPAAAFDMPAAGAVDAATASELIRSVRPTVLDVRTDGEFAAGHMPGALHIPVADLERRMEDVPVGAFLFSAVRGKRAGKGLEPAACRKAPAGNLVSDGKAPLRNRRLMALCGLMRTIHFYPRGAAHA